MRFTALSLVKEKKKKKDFLLPFEHSQPVLSFLTYFQCIFHPPIIVLGARTKEASQVRFKDQSLFSASAI